MRIRDWSSDVVSSYLKAEHSLSVFIGHDGIEQVAFTRSAKGTAADGPKPPRPDYSQKVMDQRGGIRTMAVREALASDPELALDVLLTGLLGQVRGKSYSWQQAAAIGRAPCGARGGQYGKIPGG